MAKLPNRIRELRNAQNMTLEELAEAAGISPGFLSRIETGKRGLGLEEAVRIARGLKREVTDFTSEFSEEDIAAGSALPLPGRKESGDLPNLTIHAGMGSGGLQAVEGVEGASIPSQYVDGYWSFPDRVRERFRNMPKTHALPVVGDSMSPTLIDGSIVFVDTTHTLPSPPDLYAVDYGDGLMVKRIELVPKSRKVRVISDNDARYQTHVLNRDDLTVFGRVVAWFQWRG